MESSAPDLTLWRLCLPGLIRKCPKQTEEATSGPPPRPHPVPRLYLPGRGPRITSACPRVGGVLEGWVLSPRSLLWGLRPPKCFLSSDLITVPSFLHSFLPSFIPYLFAEHPGAPRGPGLDIVRALLELSERRGSAAVRVPGSSHSLTSPAAPAQAWPLCA